MVNDITTILKKNGKVTERTMHSDSIVKKAGMKFVIRSYQYDAIGCFCTIEMSAMLGLMKMETLVFTPIGVDAPLLSIDAIHAMGNDTLLLELYDTQLGPYDTSALDAVKASASSLADHDLGTHWYDPLKMSPTLAKRGRKMQQTYADLTLNFFRTYLKTLDSAPKCDPTEKSAKTAAYVNGLFTHGGPSTDQFIKMIGKERAEALFKQYVFSSEPKDTTF